MFFVHHQRNLEAEETDPIGISLWSRLSVRFVITLVLFGYLNLRVLILWSIISVITSTCEETEGEGILSMDQGANAPVREYREH